MRTGNRPDGFISVSPRTKAPVRPNADRRPGLTPPYEFHDGHLPNSETRFQPGTPVTVTLTVTGYVAADGLITDGEGGVMLCADPYRLSQPSHVAYAGERHNECAPVPNDDELYQEVSAYHATTHHGAFDRAFIVTVHGPHARPEEIS